MPPTVWAWVGLGWLGMGFEPRFWLHWRQVTRALSMVSPPPRAAGTTWSGSGLRGWSVVPQASGCPQSGQWVCPLACARWRTRTRQRLWRAVPVREVPGLGVMRVSVARPPTSCGPVRLPRGVREAGRRGGGCQVLSGFVLLHWYCAVCGVGWVLVTPCYGLVTGLLRFVTWVFRWYSAELYTCVTRRPILPYTSSFRLLLIYIRLANL